MRTAQFEKLRSEAEVRTTPIVGFRFWKLTEQGVLTSSGSTREYWLPGQPLRARHRHRAGEPDPHPAPWSHCHCGLYALTRVPHTWSMAFQNGQRSYTGGVASKEDIAGVVLLWGSVLENEYGWKGEYGYPVELYVPASVARLNPLVAVNLQERYGVPVITLPEGSGRNERVVTKPDGTVVYPRGNSVRDDKQIFGMHARFTETRRKAKRDRGNALVWRVKYAVLSEQRRRLAASSEKESAS